MFYDSYINLTHEMKVISERKEQNIPKMSHVTLAPWILIIYYANIVLELQWILNIRNYIIYYTYNNIKPNILLFVTDNLKNFWLNCSAVEEMQGAV